MFEDSLLESANRFKTRRGRTTVLSAALQLTILGTLVLLPLIYTDALPRVQMLGTLLPPPPSAARAPSAPPHRGSRPVISEVHDGRLRLPTSMPVHARVIEDPAPPDAGGCGDSCMGVPGGTGPELAKNPLLNGVLSPTTPPPARPTTERIIVSRGVTEGHLLRRVQPEYPPLARQARIEGDVLLRAVIGRDGSIQALSVVSGHPFLARAALEAVQQWRYQPFLLSGRAVEVDSEVLVRFRLSER